MSSIIRGNDLFDTADYKEHVSVPTSYHIYNGEVTATNTVVTNGFATKLHTGNGTTQAVVTDVDMDTQWGNDVSEKFGGLVWCKGRSFAAGNTLFDTVRGVTKMVTTNSTIGESVESGITAFNNNGFSLGSAGNENTNTATYVSWNFQTTHRKYGATNHGKTYTEHYNPFTGFTIIKYEGSGLAGHEIPHSLGRKLGFVAVKNLSVASDWLAQYRENNYVHLNLTNTETSATTVATNLLEDKSILGVSAVCNTSTQQYIMYGWANSYFDEKNTLIGNYEIGVYQGTGAAGNKVTTRGKPAWVMTKRLDDHSNWAIADCLRNSFDYVLSPNLSAAESTPIEWLNVNSNGFTINYTDTAWNVSGGQYLYMVVYDNDSGSGKSKYPKATDTTNLNINALVPYANGIDTKGSKVSISYKNETLVFSNTPTQGKNYPYSKSDGINTFAKYAPMYGALRNRVQAGENPDYFDLNTNRWYSTTGGSELVVNGTFDTTTTGWTASSSTIIVENAQLKITSTGATNGFAYQSVPLETGTTYKIKLSMNTTTGTFTDVRVGTTVTGTEMFGITGASYVGTYEYIFTATATVGYFAVKTYNGIAYFDNISMFEVVPTIGTEITPRTYLDCIVYADHNGQIEYVEQLPKTTYFDEIKANEFKGKNALFAYAVINMQTTPPIVYDSYNINSVIRISTGQVDLYYKDKPDNKDVPITVSSRKNSSWADSGNAILSTTLDKVSIINVEAGTGYNSDYLVVKIHGGRN